MPIVAEAATLEPQDVAVNEGHPHERPVLGGGFDGGVDGFLLRRTNVTGATIGCGIGLAKIIQQHLATTNCAFTVADDLTQFFIGDLLFLRIRFLFDKMLDDAAILKAIKQNAVAL